MAYKTKSSPLNQGFGSSIIGSIVNQQSQSRPQNIFAGGLSGAMRNLAAQNAAQKAQEANQMQQPVVPQPVAPQPTAGFTGRTSYLRTPASSIKKQQTITPPKPTAVNPNTMELSPINPKAVGNPITVNKIYGNAMENLFTRSLPGNEAPIMQLANPDLLQDGPQLPPESVQTSVTPTLGFENN
jgi:hypothetical protein